MASQRDVLREAMHERLRAFTAAHRELLIHAAAFGRGFDLDVLASVLGRTASKLRPAVRLACAHDLLEPVDGSRDAFRFRHALTRDAIYEELVAAQLRPLHRRIGTALEQGAGKQAATIEQLAFHWWSAGDRARGSRYNEAAGDRAYAIHARVEALAYYHRALDVIGKRSASRLRIERKIGAIAPADCLSPSRDHVTRAASRTHDEASRCSCAARSLDVSSIS